MASDPDEYGQTDDGPSRSEVIALGLGAIWTVVTGLVLLAGDPPAGAEGDALRTVSAWFVCLLPLALAAVGVAAHRSGRRTVAEAARLAAAADALRQIALVDRQNRSARVSAAPADPAPDPLPPARFATSRAYPSPDTQPIAPSSGSAAAQPALDLPAGEPSETAPMEDLIVALNFPETPDDREGFRALRRALKDPRASRLIRQAQDVLTLLSQDGIYMDDLVPDRARPELWRRFAGGERGRMVGALGGIRDRAVLAAAAERMREDSIFRDAAHHFLRSFDRTFAALEPDATDEEVARISDTRSARAFMVLGRAAGIFD